MTHDSSSSNQILGGASQNTDCPCCSNRMLRHVRQQQVYWFCRECWQEMPVYNLNISASLPSRASLNKSLVQKSYSFATELSLGNEI